MQITSDDAAWSCVKACIFMWLVGGRVVGGGWGVCNQDVNVLPAQ